MFLVFAIRRLGKIENRIDELFRVNERPVAEIQGIGNERQRVDEIAKIPVVLIHKEAQMISIAIAARKFAEEQVAVV